MLFLSSSTNAKIYIHRKGQFLDLNGRMGYKVLKVTWGLTVKAKKNLFYFKVAVNEQFQAQVTYEDIR